MKHPDETAQISALQLAKRKRYAKDIDSLIVDYERLLQRERSATRKAENLEKHLGAMRRARDEFKSKHAALSKENRALKTTLSALRQSKSLRLGRMITEPANAALSVPARLAKLVVPSRGSKTEVPVPAPAAGTSLPAVPPAHQPAPAPVSQTATEDEYAGLVSGFSESPSKGALIKLISHEYFLRGAIALPAARIKANSELLADVSPAETHLIENILGQDRLMDAGVFLSPPQPNPGYLVERGRVMYCAHSTGQFNSNGYSTRTAGLVAGLKAHDEDVIVVARPGYPWDVKTDVPTPGRHRFEQEISGVTHIFNPGPSWTKDRVDHYLTESADIFVREAQRSRAAVIHAASNHITALPALMAARRLGIPFIYEVRGLWEITELSNKPGWADSDRYRLAVQLETVVAREADAVFAITSQVADELVRRGVEPSAVTLLPNSVDTDTFKPMPPAVSLRRKLGLADDSVVIGYAGSLVAYEGVADLLAATRLVADQGLDARLVVVGDGKQLAELKEMAAGLGIQDRVVFSGRVPATSVPDYVSLFDIMPCPRRRLPVTEMVSPLKPLEAMASGKALILSNLAPSRELAGERQERALLCEPGDPASLAAAIIRLGTDPELRTAMGRRSRLWAIEERTWSRTAQIAAGGHQTLQGRVAVSDARSLQELRIGIIADQFTLDGLSPEADFLVLRPESWRTQLEEHPLDALFVESAWEGTEGLWRRKVGYYDDEEFATLKSLLAHCRAAGIPTIFWNKEDPVHFNRFRITAKHFDHVFTTDADCIRQYQANAGAHLKSVASMPFYAQPLLHNILPSQRPYEHSVTYAGSYYGDKYPKRSAELAKLLNAAKDFRLTIYDRQYLNPESPYHFPAGLDRFVRGGLSYSQMVEAYKAHPVHINVNSVDASPTMFSRRVMEIAASGGAVVSGTGQGVDEVLNGLVPVVKGHDDARLLMNEWMNHEDSRLRDVWLAYRLVHRAHTAAHRLAYALRTAGLTVRAPEPPSYAIFLAEAEPGVLASINLQTVQPRLVFAAAGTGAGQDGVLEAQDLADARRQAAAAGVDFIGTLPAGVADRAVFEDLLTAAASGSLSSVGFSEDDLTVSGLGLAQWGCPAAGSPRIEAVQPPPVPRDLTLRRSLLRAPGPDHGDAPSVGLKRVLIAGHDLKFAAGLVDELRRHGHTVIFDHWLDHNKHDEDASLALLEDADVVFCEWALGNAVWYSRNKQPHQRLVLRVHSQEIFRPYLKGVEFSRVDEIIFVGRHILDIAVRDHGVPASRCVLIPNAVDAHGLSRPKTGDSRFSLGLVGIVPAQKHLDKALDVLKELRAADTRYRLFVKGKRPEDFAWMAARPEEMRYYEEQYRRIASDPDLAGAVDFDPHGDDMADWYAKVGVVLSVSDFESFHLTLADGAASGAVPVSLAWPGADQIYPTSWLHPDTDSMVQRIASLADDQKEWQRAAGAARDYVVGRFHHDRCLPALAGAIVGSDVPAAP